MPSVLSGSAPTTISCASGMTEDGFDMYVVGLEHVPQRKDWVANKQHNKNKPDPEIPVFVPMQDLEPHLIEKFSIIRSERADSGGLIARCGRLSFHG
jgi:hypothetical protein